MMIGVNSTRVLLVEGRSDEAFFSALCSSLALTPKVQVAPPRAVGGKANNKEGIFRHLPILLNQFADGRIERLATVVDADHIANHGLGYQATVNRFCEVVAPFGFTLRNPMRRVNGGLLFQSAHGLADLGLWVMPGTLTDGMLEDWVKGCITPGDAALLNTAVQAVAGLPTPKFVPLHSVKAQVATWLAWQEAPGRGLESAVTETLLNTDNPQYKLLTDWLLSVFS